MDFTKEMFFCDEGNLNVDWTADYMMQNPGNIKKVLEFIWSVMRYEEAIKHLDHEYHEKKNELMEKFGIYN